MFLFNWYVKCGAVWASLRDYFITPFSPFQGVCVWRESFKLFYDLQEYVSMNLDLIVYTERKKYYQGKYFILFFFKIFFFFFLVLEF